MALDATESARPRQDDPAAGLLPVATTFLAIIVSIQPVPIPGCAALTPAFTLMTIYHWTIYRPNLLPSTGLFVLGLLQDLLAGATPGMTSLILLLARGSLLPQRQHFIERPFPFVWAGFSLLTCCAMLLSWTLHCLLDRAAVDFHGTVFRAVLTISLFPVASFILGRTQRALMSRG
ncbi:MAG: rod shape-determining protein MreD [Alphaproteobacteria bacterium]|nr:rod shape-determining protein MreD [Alphaproteobacteria bacterium]